VNVDDDGDVDGDAPLDDHSINAERNPGGDLRLGGRPTRLSRKTPGRRSPMFIPSQPWDKVLQFYRRLEEQNAFFAPMRGLVEHVVSQPYARLLFCTTSMQALLVAQHAEIEWAHDVLRVEPTAEGTVRFRLHEQQFVKPAMWQCPVTEVVATFEGFLRRSKWVAFDRAG
jgi:hypothetical protein